MESEIRAMKLGLENQQKTLASEIRNSEDNLMRLKEGYLKVVGALEVMVILESKLTEEDDADVKTQAERCPD
jgi:hypothetical protein